MSEVTLRRSLRVYKKLNQRKSKTIKSLSKSKSTRAEINFPVSRILRYLRKSKYSKHIGTTAAVYLAATLEYLCHEILELAVHGLHVNGESNNGNTNHKRVTPRELALAIKNDDLLDKLLKSVTIPEGGVLPAILPAIYQNNYEDDITDCSQEQ